MDEMDVVDDVDEGFVQALHLPPCNLPQVLGLLPQQIYVARLAGLNRFLRLSPTACASLTPRHAQGQKPRASGTPLWANRRSPASLARLDTTEGAHDLPRCAIQFWAVPPSEPSYTNSGFALGNLATNYWH